MPRFARAAALLAALALATRRRWPSGRDVALLVALGGVGYVGQTFCYFTALVHASAGLVALLLYAYPFIVALLAAIFLHERLDGQRIVALLVAGVGLALTIGGGSGSALGVALGLGAALIYSVYIVTGTRVMARVDPVVASSIVSAAAATTYGAVALARSALGAPPQFPAAPGAWWPVLAIALISTVIAISAFFAGLRRLGASLTSVLSTLEPVVSVLLAALLLGERLSVLQMIGGLLVIATAIRLALAGSQR